MNILALENIRDQLLASELTFGFNMNVLLISEHDAFHSPDNDYHFCGTVGCIAAFSLLHKMGVQSATVHEILGATGGMRLDEAAGEHLGLHYSDWNKLFYPADWFDNYGLAFYDYITPRMAAQAIQNLLDTGSPDWSHIIKPLGTPEHYINALGYDLDRAEELASRWKEKMNAHC